MNKLKGISMQITYCGKKNLQINRQDVFSQTKKKLDVFGKHFSIYHLYFYFFSNSLVVRFTHIICVEKWGIEL